MHGKPLFIDMAMQKLERQKALQYCSYFTPSFCQGVKPFKAISSLVLSPHYLLDPSGQKKLEDGFRGMTVYDSHASSHITSENNFISYSQPVTGFYFLYNFLMFLITLVPDGIFQRLQNNFQGSPIPSQGFRTCKVQYGSQLLISLFTVDFGTLKNSPNAWFLFSLVMQEVLLE